MLTPIAMTLLIVYSAALVASYYLVRRGWIRAYPTFVVSFVVNALVLFSFSLARGNSLFQAILVSLSMAVIFSGLSVTIGTLFRNSAPLVSNVVMEPSQAHRAAA